MKKYLNLWNFFYLFLTIDCQTSFFSLETFASTIVERVIDKNILKLEQRCNQQIKVWHNAWQNQSEWAKVVLDAFGRRPSGFIYGNIVWPGEYSQCLNVQIPEWNSKYCYINKKIKWVNNLIKNETLRFKYGMCFPTLCNNDDLTKIFQYAIRNLEKDVLPFNSSLLYEAKVNCREKENIDVYTVVSMILTGVIGLFVIIGTGFDLFRLIQSENKTSKVQDAESSPAQDSNQLKIAENSRIAQILLAFSAYTNTIKLFKVEKNKSQFSCLHPMRFLAFLWVVVLHQWNHFIGIDDLLVDNKFEYLDWKKNLFFTIISNGFFCVDMFFLISGFLCAYTFLRNVSGKKINTYTLVKFYLRRYYRITVTLILIMLFMVGFNRFFHTGPFHGIFYEVNRKNCPKFFWTNILYINNIYNRFCFPHTWYLAADMQFYLISPLVLIPLSFKSKWRFVGYFLISILIFIHMITTAFFAWNFLENGQDYDRVTMMYNFLELRPWYRVAPFAFGLLLGKIIVDMPHKKFIFNKNRFYNRIIVSALWVVSIIFFNIVIFAQYGTFSGSSVMSRTSQVVYVTICRIVFSLGFGCMIFLCVTKNGYFIDKIFSWSFWLPLAKLSFCSYLVHYSIVDTFIYAQEHFIHIQSSYFQAIEEYVTFEELTKLMD